MTDIPFYLLAFLVVLGVLIVVHELGHYAAARFCGVKVLRFSLGFGRVLWRRSLGRDQTEWVLSLFPLGGYVKMLDEREGEVAPDQLQRAFNRQGLGRRSLIVAAGPLANFFLAIVLYWGIFMHGSLELLPVMGTPPVASPAAASGVRNGDEVRRLDGELVATWNDLRWMLLEKAAGQESVELEVINPQREISTYRLDLHLVGARGWEGDALESLGIVLFRPDLPAILGKVVAGGVGEQAGLLPGDKVRAVNGEEIPSWYDLVIKIRNSAGLTLQFEIERGGQVLNLPVIPEAVVERGRSVGKIGVGVAAGGTVEREMRTFVRYGFLPAGAKALAETWDKSVFSLLMFGKMLTGEVSWKNLSGPVTIADYAGQSARLGLEYYLKFMALVSISLGVLNLLPVPVLDGGHLMYHIVEFVMRRPLSERAMEVGQRIGMSFLFVLMAFAFFNDINRLVFG